MASRVPRELPEFLLRETPTVKLLWFYLRLQGVVEMSQRDLVGALGLNLGSIQSGIRRLEELRLIEYEGEVRERTRRRYSALGSPKVESELERV